MESSSTEIKVAILTNLTLSQVLRVGSTAKHLHSVAADTSILATHIIKTHGSPQNSLSWLSSRYKSGPLAAPTLSSEALEKLFDLADKVAKSVNPLDFARRNRAFLLIDHNIFIKPDRPYLQLVASAVWLLNSCRASTCLLEATLLRGKTIDCVLTSQATRTFLQEVLKNTDQFKLTDEVRKATIERIVDALQDGHSTLAPAIVPLRRQKRGGYEQLAFDMHSFLAGELGKTTAYTTAICRMFKSPVGNYYDISVTEVIARERVRGVITYKGGDVGGSGWASFLRHLSKGDPGKSSAGNSYRQVTVFSRQSGIVTMNPLLVSLLATRVTEL